MSVKFNIALLALGAGAAYFLDPVSGKKRCDKLQNQFRDFEYFVEDMVSAAEDAGNRASEFVEQITDSPSSLVSSSLAKKALGSLLLLGGARSAGLSSILCGAAGAAILARSSGSQEEPYPRWQETNRTH